jgi:hypothetical protein
MNKRLYCIVGPGRSGSSLLAAVIANSGGNFGMEARVDWDHVKGCMEHPWGHASYTYLSRKRKLSDSILPQRLFGMAYLDRQFKSTMSKLKAVDYAKSSTLIWVVPYLTQVGIAPKVIVSFRDFGSYALSRHCKFGWDFDRLVDSYINVYMTAWVQLHLYGGLIVDYADMCDTANDEWLSGISELTGLRTDDLVASRDRIVKQAQLRSMELPGQVSARIGEVSELMLRNKNRVFVGQ